MNYISALSAFTLITIVYLLIEVAYTYRTFGFGFGWSSNRPPRERSPLGNRIRNALQNQVESATYIVPALGAAAAVGLEHQGAEIAALIIVIGRVLFAPLYYSGVPFIGLPAWGAGWLGSAYIALILFQAA